jgi:hypothetical protein
VDRRHSILSDGKRIGFLDHPTDGDNGGCAASVDLAKSKRALSGVFEAVEGLSWSPDGTKLWFTAAHMGANLNMYAAGRPGREWEAVFRVGTLLTITSH